MPHREREAIVLLALAAFTAGISLRCVEPMLPKLAADFGTSVPATSVIVTSFGFAYAGAVLMAGPLGDRYGKLRIVTLAMALTGIASLGCASAWDLGSLAALRFVTGIVSSASVAVGMAYIGEVVPLGERQATLANFIAGSLLGQTLGPLFGGAFTDWLGWRASFVTLGAAFLTVSIVLYARMAASWGAVGPGRFQPLAVYRRILVRRPVQVLAATGVAETFFFFGPYVFLGALFKLRMDLSFTLIGLLLAGYGVGGLIYSASIRLLLKALGERGMVAAGGALGALSFNAILFVRDWPWAIPFTVALGTAFYMIHNVVQLKATEVAPDARGAAVAMYASCWAIGQATGVAALGFAATWLGFEPMIAAFGVGFCLLGLWLRSNLGRFKPGPLTQS